MKALSPQDFMKWFFAGGCSLAIHAVVITLFVLMGGPGRATPADPLDAGASVVSTPSQKPPTDVPPPDLGLGAPEEPKPAPPPARPAARPRPSRAASRPSRSVSSNATTVSLADAEETPFSATGTPVKNTASASTDAPKTRNYTVKPGDNLTRLARDCGSTNAELAKLNGVDEKTLANLKVGQVIKLKAKE